MGRVPKGALLEPWWGARFLMEAQRDRPVASHDGNVDPRPSPPGLQGPGGAVEALPGLVSPASPPQGELNGQRGLVPSNFLEGPGPEAGGSDREPGAAPSEGQVSEDLGSRLSSWVSMLRRGRGAAACSGPGAHGAQERVVPTARGNQPG